MSLTLWLYIGNALCNTAEISCQIFLTRNICLESYGCWIHAQIGTLSRVRLRRSVLLTRDILFEFEKKNPTNVFEVDIIKHFTFDSINEVLCTQQWKIISTNNSSILGLFNDMPCVWSISSVASDKSNLHIWQISFK